MRCGLPRGPVDRYTETTCKQQRPFPDAREHRWFTISLDSIRLRISCYRNAARRRFRVGCPSSAMGRAVCNVCGRVAGPVSGTRQFTDRGALNMSLEMEVFCTKCWEKDSMESFDPTNPTHKCHKEQKEAREAKYVRVDPYFRLTNKNIEPLRASHVSKNETAGLDQHFESAKRRVRPRIR
jgi:hypothetical protein